LGNMFRHAVCVISTLLILTFSFLVSQSHSQPRAFSEPGSYINYAYATWIGTGYYTVGNQDVFIFRVPLTSYTLREATEEQIGYRLLFPLTLGFHNFDGFDNLDILPESVATVALVPGLEMSIPVLKNWHLRPFGQIGYGNDFESDKGAWIFGAGVKSLAVFPWDQWELQLGNTLMAASQNSSAGFDNGFSMFEIGLNVKNPWDFNFLDRDSHIDTFYVYTHIMNDMDFYELGREPDEVGRLHQLGATLVPDRQYKIWFVKLKGMGLSYLFGDELKAIKLHTGFPF